MRAAILSTSTARFFFNPRKRFRDAPSDLPAFCGLETALRGRGLPALGGCRAICYRRQALRARNGICGIQEAECATLTRARNAPRLNALTDLMNSEPPKKTLPEVQSAE